MNNVKSLFLESYANTSNADEIVEGVVRLLSELRLTTAQADRVIRELNKGLEADCE